MGVVARSGSLRACGACGRSCIRPMCWRCAPTIICVVRNADGLIETDPEMLGEALSPADGPTMLHAKAQKACGSITGQGSGCPGFAMRNGSAGY